MQCLFFIWRPGHHMSSEELQGLGKGVMGDSKFKIQINGSHSNRGDNYKKIFYPKIYLNVYFQVKNIQ